LPHPGHPTGIGERFLPKIGDIESKFTAHSQDTSRIFLRTTDPEIKVTCETRITMCGNRVTLNPPNNQRGGN
jgi:hypothetical protein